MHALHAASDGAEVLSTDAGQRGRQPDGFGSDPRPQIGAKIAHRPQTARCRIRSEAQMDPTASDAGLPIAGYAASWLAAHDRARPAFTAAAAVLFAGAPAALVTFAGDSLLGAGIADRRNAAPDRPVVLAPVGRRVHPDRCQSGVRPGAVIAQRTVVPRLGLLDQADWGSAPAEPSGCVSARIQAAVSASAPATGRCRMIGVS